MSKQKLPISACILVHEDRSQLQAAVESLSFASEILCIDSQSNVDWSHPTLADCTVIQAPTQSELDFSALRNFAISHTQNEWVVMLDSDEVIASLNQNQLEKDIESNALGFKVKRTDVFLGKEVHFGEASQSNPVRLFKKSGRKYVGKVHERLMLTQNLSRAAFEISHSAHKSTEHFLSKINVYAKIAASEPKNLRFLTLKLLFYPPLKFLHTFVIKSGWRDGWRGLIYSLLMSIHSLAVRAYGYEARYV